MNERTFPIYYYKTGSFLQTPSQTQDITNPDPKLRRRKMILLQNRPALTPSAAVLGDVRPVLAPVAAHVVELPETPLLAHSFGGLAVSYTIGEKEVVSNRARDEDLA